MAGGGNPRTPAHLNLSEAPKGRQMVFCHPFGVPDRIDATAFRGVDTPNQNLPALRAFKGTGFQEHKKERPIQ